MSPLLTWGDWLTSSGFGGATAVLAAVVAFIGTRRASTVQRENARKDQWWDRLKWAVDLVLSGDEAAVNVGLAALGAVAEAHGFDADELNFLRRVTELFLGEPQPGTLEAEAATGGGTAMTTSSGGAQPSLPQSVLSQRNKVAAARLRVSLDRKLGVETPKWIRELAETKAS